MMAAALFLTKPHIASVTTGQKNSTGASVLRREEAHSNPSSVKQSHVKPDEENSVAERKANQNFKREKVIDAALPRPNSRRSMLATLHAMGKPPAGSTPAAAGASSYFHHQQRVPDAWKCEYRIHKWRLKSGGRAKASGAQLKRLAAKHAPRQHAPGRVLPPIARNRTFAAVESRFLRHDDHHHHQGAPRNRKRRARKHAEDAARTVTRLPSIPRDPTAAVDDSQPRSDVVVVDRRRSKVDFESRSPTHAGAMGRRKTIGVTQPHRHRASPSDKGSSSPINRSSSVQFSLPGVRSGSKEGESPNTLDSDDAKQRRKRMKAMRNLRMDSRGSPHFFNPVNSRKLDAMMHRWRVVARLSILLSRLWNSHRIVVDDSFNIRSGDATRGESSREEGTSKHEVLFDIRDYKMKNQLRLSETTRRILSLKPEQRTEKEVNLVEAALRNVKAISDCSSSIQKQIARNGYFSGVERNRVIVQEGWTPFNYYILLAGTAVIIKKDERGTTNPVQFLKRGDVFGEHEILEKIRWNWGVVTLGYCEFLTLDRNTYQRIFITGDQEEGGEDRGGFLGSVSLLHDWPVQLLKENPNRCLFRHFKRGALVVKDNLKSEWIFVVKSGSCTVMKTIHVEDRSNDLLLSKAADEQKFHPKIKPAPHLVDKTGVIDQEGHEKKLAASEERFKDKAKSTTVYQQLEMSSVLKELNADVMGTTASPRAEADYMDNRSEFSLMTTVTRTNNNRAHNHSSSTRHKGADVPLTITEDLSKFMTTDGDAEDRPRLSRHSDRRASRTPSPMKVAYLRTGRMTPGNDVSDRGEDPGNGEQARERQHQGRRTEGVAFTEPPVVEVDDFAIFGADTPLRDDETNSRDKQPMKEVHVAVRKLTKGETFGLNPVLYADQPQLSLVSNGAECLMLNKRFYLDHASDDCLAHVREMEYPYPTDDELLEQHWKLVTWDAYRAKVMDDYFHRKGVLETYGKTY